MDSNSTMTKQDTTHGEDSKRYALSGMTCRSESGFDFIDLAVLLTGMLIYLVVARVWEPPYFIKSLFKAIAFVVMPIAVSFLPSRHLDWIKVNLSSRKLRLVVLSILLISIVTIFLLVLFTEPLARFFGVDAILMEIKGRTNAPYWKIVASVFYIITINACMEELYFRGYILQRLIKRVGFYKAAAISSTLFALYHLITFRNWFNPLLLLLALTGLFLAGFILSFISHRYESLLPAWLMHAMMNVAVFAVAYPYF